MKNKIYFESITEEDKLHQKNRHIIDINIY